ncbi:MAG: hypothetical protein K2H35_05630 [Muribaculaceae bacterium]|nr:hypothetical protein [Muribaculaceae bacterium]
MNKSGILTISVNPAESTIGSLHPEVYVNRVRRNFDLEGARVARRKSGTFLRTIFGATSISGKWSILLLIARVLFGGFMIYDGISAAGTPLTAIISIIIGVLLIIGLSTRLVMTATAIGFGIIAGMAIEAGGLPITTIAIAAASAVMAIAGPGRYSSDAMIRRNIFRKIRRYETRKLMDNRFSYRAYQYAREF